MTSAFALFAEFLILFQKCLSVDKIPLAYPVVLRWLQTSYKQLYSVTELKGECSKYLFIRLKKGFGARCGWSHWNCVFKKKVFLSPDNALGFGSKLHAADAQRIHNSKKSPDAEEGGVEAESSPLTMWNVYERGGRTTREAFFIVCSKHPLVFHSPWLSYLSFNLWVGGRLQLYSLLLHELMMWGKSHRSSSGLWGKLVWGCSPGGEWQFISGAWQSQWGGGHGSTGRFSSFFGLFRQVAFGHIQNESSGWISLYRSACHAVKVPSFSVRKEDAFFWTFWKRW